MNNNEKCYQVTRIIGNTLTAISCNKWDKDVIALNKHTCDSFGFTWVMSLNCTSTVVSSIDYEFGEPVIPAQSSRKMTYIHLNIIVFQMVNARGQRKRKIYWSPENNIEDTKA